MGRFSLFATAGALVVGLLLTTGCEELSARRQIQEAGDLYGQGRYSDAVKLYASALEKAPHLDIGHHNAGLTHLKLFQASSDDEAARAHADRATEHLQVYLEANPDDSRIRSLITRTWLDAERYENARDYWTTRLEEFPDNRSIMQMLANIERQAGEFSSAIAWHHKRLDLVSEDRDKIEVLIDIAQLQLSRLRNVEVVGAERAAIADVAIAALQQAAELDPEHVMVQSFLGSIYQLRALAHGASWARKVDLAASRIHLRRWRELNEAAQAAVAPAPGDGEDGDEDDADDEAADSDGDSEDP
jgi:tetratricopeptide (TPR) repeat protein